VDTNEVPVSSQAWWSSTFPYEQDLLKLKTSLKGLERGAISKTGGGGLQDCRFKDFWIYF
jgi:hypothetical protein